jgi:hypothetical protein
MFLFKNGIESNRSNKYWRVQEDYSLYTKSASALSSGKTELAIVALLVSSSDSDIHDAASYATGSKSSTLLRNIGDVPF